MPNRNGVRRLSIVIAPPPVRRSAVSDHGWGKFLKKSFAAPPPWLELCVKEAARKVPGR